MATLATETWTGTDGAAWPAQWTVTGTATILSNKGRFTPSASAFASGRAYLSGMTAATDTDVTVFVSRTTTTGQFAGVSICADNTIYSGTTTLPGTGYCVALNYGATTAGSNVQLFRNSGGTSQTQLGSTVAIALDGPVTYGVRIQRTGTTIQCKVWDTAGAEPGSWTISQTDGSPLAANKVLLAWSNGSVAAARPGDWDNLTVTDGAAPALTVSAGLSGSGTLTATVQPALSSAAGLSGSGALSGTVTPKVTVSGALSGSGVLTPVVGISVNAELSGLGLLGGSVNGALTVGLTADGQLDATTSFRLFTWYFRTPTQRVSYRLAGRGLIGSYEQALSVYRVGGQWHTKLSPTADDLAGADRHFPGGYEHELTAAELAELIDAGFAAYISAPAARVDLDAWVGISTVS